MLRIKQARHEVLAMALGRLLGERISRVWPTERFDWVIPVPMHWSRRWMRGMSSAEVIGEMVARRLGVPLTGRMLRCTRLSRKQGTLLPSARFSNVRGAFKITTGYDINDCHVLLVDDILTTGATASEAARVLRRGGAAFVSVAVIARGVGGDSLGFVRSNGQRQGLESPG